MNLIFQKMKWPKSLSAQNAILKRSLLKEYLSLKIRPSDSTSKKSDPWDSVLNQMECVSCHMIIPAHLGERWDDLSLEQAQKQWKDLYKKNNKKQKF